MQSTSQQRIFLSIALAIIVLMFSSSVGFAQKPKIWEVGTPIVTYWAGPLMTDTAAQQLANGGWNVVWCTEAELNVAQRHGLRAQLNNPLLTPSSLDNPTQRAALDALIERVRNHPALYSYFLGDEPDAKRFPDLGRLVAYLRKRDPAHLAYINLFPTYASKKQLGANSYREYLRQFITIVKPSLLSYDHYQFAINSDSPDYFLNLALVRRAAQGANLPFLNIVQASTWTPNMREPGETEMRYLVNTTLAYGAKGISYYVYSYPRHSPGIATLEGKPTRVYDWLRRLNPKFVAIASQVQPLTSTGVYHMGMLPPGAEPLPSNFEFTLDPPLPTLSFRPNNRTRGVLFGCFSKSKKDTLRPSHVFVVNLDYLSDTTLTLKGTGTLELFDADSGKWKSCHSRKVTVSLPPGGGRLLRIKH